MRAARGLRFPRGCWSLTSGATSGSRILPGERASGECWRCGGRGEGPRWPLAVVGLWGAAVPTCPHGRPGRRGPKGLFTGRGVEAWRGHQD